VLLDSQHVHDEDEVGRQEHLDEEALDDFHVGAEGVADEEGAGEEAVDDCCCCYAGDDLGDEDDYASDGLDGADEDEA